MTLLPKRRAPEQRRLYRTQVVHTRQTSAHFVTITLGGGDLADFRPMGADQWFRFFFRREGQAELRLPTTSGGGWMAQTLLLRQAVRPWVRNYTVRAFRATTAELDVEFAIHGDLGPAARFAERVRPGEDVALLDEGITYLPPDGAHRLVVADESAVPAALAILDTEAKDTAATATPTTVLLEVPAKDDVRELDTPSHIDVRWLSREATDAGMPPGRLALAALTDLPLPPPPHYAWLAGESGLATGARRLLTRERGYAKADVAFMGYWRAGRSSPG